jgi:hypothetical protein
MKKKIEKIEFASQFEIEKYRELADDFLNKVFGIESAFVTDESSLYDFDFEFDEKIVHHTEEALKKIVEIYGVDVSDVENLNLAKILQRISILKNL